MRIVHASDWHGRFRTIPPADLYVFTGDLYPDMPRMDARWDPENTAEQYQRRWAARFVSEGGMMRYLEDLSVPIVCVRGNHDFAPLAPLFQGCNLVHEFVDNEVVEVLGRRITGHRGIPYIYGGWVDEVRRPDLQDRFRAMPVADIYLTHYPLYGVLDCPRMLYGLEGVASWFSIRHCPDDPDDFTVNVLHLFGHIHEDGGKTLEVGNILFSNAACSVNVIDMPQW